nr:hypothetical protein [uncultured Gellertiella sp.]
MRTQSTLAVLKLVRLSLGGSVLAIALFNIMAPYFGAESHTFADGISAGLGFATSAVAVKALHIV